MDRSRWPEYKEELERVFLTKTRDEWSEIMEGSDVCFAPVLSILEAPQHPHNQHRSTFVEIDGVMQPAPAPRFSRTVPEVTGSAKSPGADTAEILSELGCSESELVQLAASGAIPG
jgi:alpha-methylacyl-CoA racemase